MQPSVRRHPESDQECPPVAANHSPVGKGYRTKPNRVQPTECRSHLAANVEEVVLHIMRGVHREPPQRPLVCFWVVIDNCPIPVVGG
jgi:hypothetical protein